MATRSLIQLRGLIEGIPGGSKNIVPADIQNLSPPSLETQLVLTIGDNVIAIPANADGCVIIFDPTSTTVKTLKATGGLSGVVLAKNRWNVITFDTTPPASIAIESSAADAAGKYTTIIFF